MLFLLRSLRRAPGVSLAVILTLAIGVTALTVTIGIVDAAIWREPPFPDPSRITVLYLERAGQRTPLHKERWSYGRIQVLRTLATDFDLVASYSGVSLRLSGDDGAELVNGEAVSPEYFLILRARAARGRVFAANENTAQGAHPLVILGHDFWMARFGGDTTIVGRTVRVSGSPLEVIGVMPPGFRGLTDKADYWIPSTMAPVVSYPEYLTTNQNFISAVGRPRGGTPLAEVNARLKLVGTRVNAAVPSASNDSTETVTAVAVPINDARTDRATVRSLWVLLAGVALLHLLGCANAVNLLLGRAAARRREVAVRAALGGSTSRLIRPLIAEGAVLGLAGSAIGVALAMAAARGVIVPSNVTLGRNFYGAVGTFDALTVGARLAGIGALVALVSTLAVAWVPATSALALDLIGGLRDGTRGAATGVSLRRISMRGAVVAFEAALAVLLVVAAGLMIDSFSRMRRVHVGVEPEHILSFWLRPSESQVRAPAAPAFVTRVIDAIAAAPGVVSVTVDGGAPLNGSARSSLRIIGQPIPERPPGVDRHYVAPAHFATLGIPVRRGRVFTSDDDENHPRVAVISETAARRFFPNVDPLGQRVWFGGGSTFDAPERAAEIIGIVGDVAYEPLDANPVLASFYTPYRQFTYGSRVVFVKVAGEPVAAVPAVRAAIAAVEPDIPLADIRPLTDLMGSSWARHEFDAWLFGAFGSAALALAALGIFAVVTYSVAQRTREMGIRLALGAPSARVIRLVLAEGMVFPLAGLVIGGASALALTRLLRASLYEVNPTDPLILSLAVVVLAGVALLACLVPARRATRVDPLTALRSE